MGKKHYYKRGWSHSKMRGREGTVSCGFCGRLVPKYKTFSVSRGFRITDPVVRQELGMRLPRMLTSTKMYACPSCARHRRIVRKKR